jgi:UPF0716 protein FxsA
MRLFLAFLLVPLIEIALFIQVGGLIGLWPTLLIVIVTAIVGAAMVRSQGAAVMSQLRGSLNDLRDPTEPLAHGAMILFSGALLLTPGFFTDIVGFLLLVPGVRGKLYRFIRSRIVVEDLTYGTTTERGGRMDANIIDAEYEDLDGPRPSGPSGWTRH